MKCEVHQQEMTLKPAGVSKLGKPYNEFWACSVKENGAYCRYKPQQYTQPQRTYLPTPATLPVYQDEALVREKAKGESTNRAVALTEAVKWLSVMKKDANSSDVLLLAGKFEQFLAGKSFVSHATPVAPTPVLPPAVEMPVDQIPF